VCKDEVITVTKTLNIKKADITFAAHRYNVNVLLSNIQGRNRLGAQAPPPQRTSQPPQTGTVIGLFLHGCFGHHAAVG